MIKNLVISGGGLKGISLIGVYKALYEHGLLEGIQNYIGTSIGSLFISLLYIGYTCDEFEKLALQLDFTKLRNVDEDSILGFMDSFGIDNGNNFIKESTF